VRRFLATWGLLAPGYLLAALLSSWLVLNFVDLTYEAFAAWLLVPVFQAAVLASHAPRRPLLPAGRPPLAVAAPVVLALFAVAEGFRRPLNVRWGFLVPGSLQEVLPRALALLAGGAFLAAAFRSRRGRVPLAAFGALLLLLGLDAPSPFLSALPASLFPKLGPFLGGLAVYGTLVVLLFAAALVAQRPLEEAHPWAARLLGASLAFTFAAVHGALLQLFLHPWLEKPWALLVPASVSVAASLAAAAGLAALPVRREEP
jgi:hypothetical protein